MSYKNLVSKVTDISRNLVLALQAPSNGGKTYTSLEIAWHLGTKLSDDIKNWKVLMIDTEGKSPHFKNLFPDWDVIVFGEQATSDKLRLYDPKTLTEILKELSGEYNVIIIDTLSAFWGVEFSGSALDQVNSLTDASKSKNAFTSGWSKVTPLQNKLYGLIQSSPCHIICTLRQKEGFEIVDRMPVKIGLESVQRGDAIYMFDVAVNLDPQTHEMAVVKERYAPLSGMKIPLEHKLVLYDSLVKWVKDGNVRDIFYYSDTKEPVQQNARSLFLMYYNQYGEQPTKEQFKAFVNASKTAKN